MKGWVFLNGSFVPYHEARIPVEDRGFLFADSVYEVIRCYDGRPFRFDDHLARLINSAAALEIPLPYDAAGWLDILGELLRRNDLKEASVYLQVTRGVAPRSHLYEDGMTPTVVGIARPASRPSPEVLEQGVPCITVPDTRWGLCYIKSTGLLPNVLARREAQQAGAHDAIFVRDGFVTEATASNVFCVRNGTVYTYPLANILPGITRGVVLELLADLGIPAREEAVPLNWFRRAEEIWLTGTVSEAVAVVTLDGRPVGDGRPGPVTRRLQEAFKDIVPGGRQG